MPECRRFTFRFVCLTILASTAIQPARANELLFPEIDRLIEAQAGGVLASQTDDYAFARRVTLDLAGRIPTAAELREFVADPAENKRERLIDRLLQSDDHVRRMTDFWHVMLLERLGDHDEWRRFLRESVAANKSWHKMVEEMIYAPTEDESRRGAAFFVSKRLENYGQNPVDYPALVRDVGRLFLGVDVQCAQCHDHLFVGDYKQEHFQGLFAFFAQTTLRQDVKFPAVGENLVTKPVAFKSVFGGEERMTGPRLPGGVEFAVPELAKGEEYNVPPDKKTRFPGVPKFSPLKILSEQLPRGDNRAFSKNAVNRIWWMLMGRGLVHPLDLHHSDNPPSHPELLELLATQFEQHQGDIRWLLKEIALSRAYQRSSELPDSAEIPPTSYRVALEKPLSAEQLLASVLAATDELERRRPAPASSGENPAFDPYSLPEMKAWRERFAGAFANPPREPEVEFSPSVKAALFLMNDATVLGWLKPAPGNTVARLSQLADHQAVVDELYLVVLSRTPTDEERSEAIEFLAARADRRDVAVGQLVWALLASTEFCINH